MLRILYAAVVDAAPGHNRHVAVFPDIEVVVYRLLQAALREDHRDMDAFPHGAGLDVDVDSAAVLLGEDVNVRRGIPAGKSSIGPEIIRSHRDLV